VHSHSDALPFSADPLPAKILQGVTTEVTGNCGTSPFPLDPTTPGALKQHPGAPFAEVSYDWTRLAGYADRLEQVGPVSNIAPLVGHKRSALLCWVSRTAHQAATNSALCSGSPRKRSTTALSASPRA
jgi:N-acyl-D-aspartate/D-glutamate deacylase